LLHYGTFLEEEIEPSLQVVEMKIKNCGALPPVINWALDNVFEMQSLFSVIAKAQTSECVHECIKQEWYKHYYLPKHTAKKNN
jgi:hypothetical protein